MNPPPRSGARALVLLGALALMFAFWPHPAGAAQQPVRHRPVGPQVLHVNQPVPSVASNPSAVRLTPISPSKSLFITFGLSLRHGRALNAFIARDAVHGHYLTQAQFDNRFGRTKAQIGQVKQWARASGYHVAYVSRDGLTISARAPVAAVTRSLHVTIDRYRIQHRAVFANTTKPVVPRRLGIQTVSGLDDLHHARPAGIRRMSVPDVGFTPHEFRLAYNLEGHGADGTGQTIGLTGFGPTISNGDLAAFASDTGDPALSSCKSCTGPDKVQWIEIGKQSNVDATEEALDVEVAHGVALHSHLKYWLGGDGSDAPMEATLSAAANDPSLHVVSNSWGDTAIRSRNDAFVRQTTASFKHAVAVGTTFYFSTGDNGVDSGCNNPSNHCDLASYPADSPFVVAVGGTNLQMDSKFTSWTGETAWGTTRDDSSGGGCASFFARPHWQRGVKAATCKGRAVPDISADGDPASGAEVWFQGTPEVVGGTSLSAPLMTGMAAVTNRYLALDSHAGMGFAAPEIYRLARSATYNGYFHDVLCGSNGHPAGFGWDEVTGWGSIDWYAYTRGFAGQPVDPVPGPPSWSCPQSSGTTSELRAVACSGPARCHAVGSSGEIVNTFDGGHWFQPQFSSAHSTLVSISCPRRKTCYAIGSDGWLQRTSDSGNDWKASNLHISSPAGISCPSKKICYVAGGRSILKTTDGRHFQAQHSGATAPISAIACPNAKTCYGIQAAGRVLRTRDGRTWNRLQGTKTTPGLITSMSCPTRRHCYAVGTAGASTLQSDSALVYSTQNGRTWKAQVVSGSGPLSGISCAGASTCDAAGPNGDVLRTTDGHTWTLALPSISKHGFDGIACPGKSVCYGVGKRGNILQIGVAPGH